MKKGGYLPSFTLAYETWGALNADRTNAVLIFERSVAERTCGIQ